MKTMVLIMLLLGFISACSEAPKLAEAPKNPKPAKVPEPAKVLEPAEALKNPEYKITVRQVNNWYDALHSITIGKTDHSNKKIIEEFNRSGECFYVRSNNHPAVNVCRNAYDSVVQCSDSAQDLFLDIAFDPNSGWSYKVLPAAGQPPNKNCTALYPIPSVI